MKGQTDEAVGACAVVIQESVSMATIAILFPFFESSLLDQTMVKGPAYMTPRLFR